jgi:hypothetical protein
MTGIDLPLIDYARIPAEYNGSWVVLRIGAEQRVLGAGKTITEAMEASGVDSDDPTAVLTRVPVPECLVVMGRHLPKRGSG